MFIFMKLKFRYGQRVRIIDGFYEGLRGTIIGHYSEFWSNKYQVDLKKIKLWFKEKHLEPCGKGANYESNTGI